MASILLNVYSLNLYDHHELSQNHSARLLALLERHGLQRIDPGSAFFAMEVPCVMKVVLPFRKGLSKFYRTEVSSFEIPCGHNLGC